MLFLKKKTSYLQNFQKLHFSFEKIYLSPNILKNHQTIYKKARNGNMRWAEIFDCSKRDREICVKTIIPSQDTAFRFSSALNYFKLFGKISYIAWKKVKYVGLYNWHYPQNTYTETIESLSMTLTVDGKRQRQRLLIFSSFLLIRK